jgi:predicted Co/Zn/Cd cation transporter (cation efflux family)
VKRDLAVLIAVFAIVTAIAELLGAINFGTALTFGQIAFAAALVWILVRRP